MKYRPCITSVSLIVALTGLSPVVAADDAGRTAVGEQIPPATHRASGIQKNKLSPEQLDTVVAGRIDQTEARLLDSYSYLVSAGLLPQSFYYEMVEQYAENDY
jgi:hypothetical protein